MNSILFQFALLVALSSLGSSFVTHSSGISSYAIHRNHFSSNGQMSSRKVPLFSHSNQHDNNQKVRNLFDSKVLSEKNSVSSKTVLWDNQSNKWICLPENEEKQISYFSKKQNGLKEKVIDHFMPKGVTDNYMTYARWDCLHRFLLATLNILGIQALIQALGGVGKRGTRKLNCRASTTAAAAWVLKDAAGKFMRMLWAGKMGKMFDLCPKRWNFLSSMVYGLAAGLELTTKMFPVNFLCVSVIANSLKQCSIVTGSASRSSIYQSFSKTAQVSKNEPRQNSTNSKNIHLKKDVKPKNINNIGEIVSKSAAQASLMEMFGYAFGSLLTWKLGTKPKEYMIMAYFTLLFCDILVTFQEMKSVVFKTLNLERIDIILNHYFESDIINKGTEKRNSFFEENNKKIPKAHKVLSPEIVSRKETLFIKSSKESSDLNSGENLFKVLSDFSSDCSYSPHTLKRFQNLLSQSSMPSSSTDSSLKVFLDQESQSSFSTFDGSNVVHDTFEDFSKFIILPSVSSGFQDASDAANSSSSSPSSSSSMNRNPKKLKQQQTYHILLHEEADALDILKALYIHRALMKQPFSFLKPSSSSSSPQAPPLKYGRNNEGILAGDGESYFNFKLMESVLAKVKKEFRLFKYNLIESGWDIDNSNIFIAKKVKW